jgi:hypothetical protein
LFFLGRFWAFQWVTGETNKKNPILPLLALWVVFQSRLSTLCQQTIRLSGAAGSLEKHSIDVGLSQGDSRGHSGCGPTKQAARLLSVSGRWRSLMQSDRFKMRVRGFGQTPTQAELTRQPNPSRALPD